MYAKAFRHVAVVLLPVCILSGCISDPPKPEDNKSAWRPPYENKQTPGGQLEVAYNQMFTKCEAAPLQFVHDAASSLGLRLSDVPLSVQQDYSVQPQIDQPAWIANKSLGTVFAYVYDTDDISKLSLDNKTPIDLIAEQDLVDDPVDMILAGGVKNVYIHNCDSTYKEALTASAQTGLTVPLADLKTALHSDETEAKSAFVTVAVGDFESKIARILNTPSSGDPDFIFYSTMVWDWYYRQANFNTSIAAQGTSASQPHYIVASLSGLAFSFGTSQRTNSSGDLSFNVNGDNPIYTGNFSSDYILKRTIDESVSGATTVGFRNAAGVPRLTMQRLPLPSEMIASLNKPIYSGELIDTTTPLEFITSQNLPTQSHVVYEIVDGVPSAFCNKGSWQPIWAASNVQIVIDAIDTKHNSDKNYKYPCEFEFTVSYTAPATPAAPTTDPQQGDIPFTLMLVNKVDGSALTLPMQTITYVTAPLPTVEDGSWNHEFVIDSPRQNMSWSVVTHIKSVRGDTKMNWNGVAAADVSGNISCGDSSKYTVTLADDPHYDRNKLQLTVPLTYAIQPNDNFDISDTAKSSPRSCKFSGVANVTEASDPNGDTFPIPFSVSLNLPPPSPPTHGATPAPGAATH